jgi:hypothetical protein
MQQANTKKLTDVYKEALIELRKIKIRQDEIIKKYSKILEKEKIEKLRKELQK